jgi:TusA-related sulfurtransferase
MKILKFFTNKTNSTKNVKSGIKALVSFDNDIAIIDVRGQTCPGYLLAINKAVNELNPNTKAKLLMTYPPCIADVKAWCSSKGIDYLSLEKTDKAWIALIQK